MRTKILFFALMASCFTLTAQKVTNGPELDNDRDNTMNRLLQGDEGSFYAYRIRTKGRGTSFFIEKYDKAGLKPVFSKEVEVEVDKYTKVEDVKYSQDNVYIFIRQYNKDDDKMTLYYRTVSSKGAVSPSMKQILDVKTDHYEFVDFDIYANPSSTKFMVKASYKSAPKEPYTTHFVFYDSKTMKKLSEKQVDMKLFAGRIPVMSFFFGGAFGGDSNDFLGLMIDDNDNIFYGYCFTTKDSKEKELHYKLKVDVISATATAPKSIEMNFDDDYYVGDVEFAKNNTTNELVVGGFLKDVIERKGRDLVKVGIFSFTINLADNSVKSKVVTMFDDKILFALESNPRRSKYFRYKLDYMLPVGKDIFYVGQQFDETVVTTYDPNTHSSRTTYEYEYMDVIVAKLNSKGQFEWIKNAPCRMHKSLSSPHVFKLYIAMATEKNIFLLYDEHAKNLDRFAKADFEPKDLKTMSGIHGSNFICSTISTSDGKLDHKLVFENDSYCFNPVQENNFAFMPPPDTELFVRGKNNEIYIYTEDRGRDRFSKIEFQ